MSTEKICPWCETEFVPTHGNQTYDTPECANAAKAEQQKTKRDPVAKFIPILINNHERIESAFNDGKVELTREEIELYQIDISLVRYLKPSPQFEGHLMLDLGVFFLITRPDFSTFKIFKHETAFTF